MSKTKIVEKIVRFELFLTGIGQYYVKVTKTRFFQNWILRNTHRHQPFDFYKIAELRKTLVAELRKTYVLQKRNRAILREITFPNDCTNCCFFSRKTDAQRKILRFVQQKLCKVLRMETLARNPGNTVKAKNTVFYRLIF